MLAASPSAPRAIRAAGSQKRHWSATAGPTRGDGADRDFHAGATSKLHAERFADTGRAEAWAILLDEGTYLASVSTFCRLLR
jgi:hypothetical protein